MMQVNFMDVARNPRLAKAARAELDREGRSGATQLDHNAFPHEAEVWPACAPGVNYLPGSEGHELPPLLRQIFNVFSLSVTVDALQAMHVTLNSVCPMSRPCRSLSCL